MRTQAKPSGTLRRRAIRVLGALLACGVLTALGTGNARAQLIADRPPLLNGTLKAKQVLVATGLNSGASVAVFICTSLERTGGKNLTVGVEWWSNASLENDVTAGEGVVVLTPGATVILATNDTAYYQGEVLIPNASGGERGSARILATSKKIVCTVHSLDRNNNPPTFLSTVPLYVGGKQK